MEGVLFVAFDVETTGFSPEKERIIEIGAVKFQHGKIIESRSWLINPAIPIKNSFVHGITDQMVKNRPAFPDSFREFEQFISGSTLIAHNARFDLRFLRAELKRNQMTPPEIETIDSLALFRVWFPEEASHALGKLALSLNIPNDNAHRAVGDSELIRRIFEAGRRTHSPVTLTQLTEAAGGLLQLNKDSSL